MLVAAIPVALLPYIDIAMVWKGAAYLVAPLGQRMRPGRRPVPGASGTG
jgi:hypothetical protein